MHSVPSAIIFYSIAAVVIISALAVTFSKNILHSAFALLGTLGGVAGLYLFLGADFVGIAQIIIYVGGILVLILFAVLLTNRIQDVKISNVALPRMGAMVPVLFGLTGLLFLVLHTPWPLTQPAAAPTTARIGDAFLREYLLPFELASVLLLLALIGAVVIARRAVRDEAQDPDPHHERLV
ncbi:MAG TPA: NADH-quinone oxidoreductase subunit J [Polyangia bacterium]|jgi:NADH-quinone oxidoreductase subunit J